jgi:hypothetical protein
MKTPHIPVEEVLDAILLEEATPTYEALVRWCERYPEYRNELAKFFATWGEQESISQDVEIDEDRLASVGVSHALNLLADREEKHAQGKAHPEPGTRLLLWARRCGITNETLARETGLDVVLLTKLDMRRLTGVPLLCIERLATALHTSINFIMPMITGPPQLQPGLRHKSKRRPTATTENFADAIRNASLDDANKRFWLEATSNHRETGHP